MNGSFYTPYLLWLIKRDTFYTKRYKKIVKLDHKIKDFANEKI